jgi:hypothetical protein
MKGDALSDEELKSLSDFYLDMVIALGELGCEFTLAEYECRRRLKTLEGFSYARRWPV